MDSGSLTQDLGSQNPYSRTRDADGWGDFWGIWCAGTFYHGTRFIDHRRHTGAEKERPAEQASSDNTRNDEHESLATLTVLCNLFVPISDAKMIPYSNEPRGGAFP